MHRSRIFIVGYFFNRRSKARIISLYNRLMYSRRLLRRSARTHIRFQIKKNTFIADHTMYFYFSSPE
jgi:hypothetical protein